jgi:hypothetical protein
MLFHHDDRVVVCLGSRLVPQQLGFQSSVVSVFGVMFISIEFVHILDPIRFWAFSSRVQAKYFFLVRSAIVKKRIHDRSLFRIAIDQTSIVPYLSARIALSHHHGSCLRSFSATPRLGCIFLPRHLLAVAVPWRPLTFGEFPAAARFSRSLSRHNFGLFSAASPSWPLFCCCIRVSIVLYRDTIFSSFLCCDTTLGRALPRRYFAITSLCCDTLLRSFLAAVCFADLSLSCFFRHRVHIAYPSAAF